MNKKPFVYKDSNTPKEPNHSFISKEDYQKILDNIPLVCVDLVIRQGNKVLLIKRENRPCLGVYWIQGGRLSKNEAPEACGIRKTAIELQIPEDKIKIVDYLGTFSSEFQDSEQGSASHTVNITYLAEIEDGVSLSFDENHSDAQWFMIDGTIPENLKGSYEHHPYIKEVLSRIEPLRVLVTGASGFIGSHLGKRLKKEGYYVIGADWNAPEFMETSDFCDEFHLVDLRSMKNCLQVCKNVAWVFNLAADMGGMGFIQSNNSRIGYNNTMVSLNVLEASRQCGVKRYFYASSACVYPLGVQNDASNTVNLKEEMAWPANPQDIYGLEKLYAEQVAINYGEEFPELKVRVGRFHGIYGEFGTWKGGREKVPAAFCRKAASSVDSFEIWGDGQQTRSFLYIDDCVEAVLRILQSDYEKPLNVGSEELISINDLARLVMSFADKDLPLNHVDGPEGVRGRNSDNSTIEKVLNWKPSIPLAVGLRKTFDWINSEIEIEASKGVDVEGLSNSEVVKTEAPKLDFVD